MIKMLCQVPRKPGMAQADFFPRYLHGHGDLVREHARAMGILRSVQAHRIEQLEDIGFTAGSWREPLDGQSELWWESWASMETALASPEGARASALLETDEQAFTDTSNVSGFVAIEDVLLDHSNGSAPGTGSAVKMVIDTWKRPDQSAADFSARWRGEHAKLVTKHAKAMGISKYVQNHCDPEAKFDFAELRGWQPAPDGVSEIWWPRLEAMKQAMASPDARKAISALRSDEETFTSPQLTRGFLSREHSIFDYIAPTP